MHVREFKSNFRTIDISIFAYLYKFYTRRIQFDSSVQ